MSALSTPAFLVDETGALVFYNEAAGALLGRRFEEQGTVGPTQWAPLFGPADPGAGPVEFESLPLVRAIRGRRPAHAELTIRSTDGTEHPVEVSALPILTAEGSQGAIAVLCPTDGAAEGIAA